jgi:3-phosphoshikimate 1-carboxyvinyltransferase
MDLYIHPSNLRGELMAPPSKSSMQRACAAALLRKGKTIIHNPGCSQDDLSALGVIRDLGARVDFLPDGSVAVDSDGVQPRGDQIHCGESGLGMRMFAPLIALSGKRQVIQGEGSLLGRPMDFFDQVLPQLGVQVSSQGGKLPISLQGPLKPADISIDGSLSSQFLTGLLLAYAAAGASHVSIRVNNLKSKPYIDLTLQVMRQFGWKVENRQYQEFYFDGPVNGLEPGGPIHYTVEGDWSGAAFLLVGAAIGGEITLNGLDLGSSQADKAVLRALKDSGAVLHEHSDRIRVGRGALNPFSFDATDCPDLFPPLATLAAYCSGTTEISGALRLAHKESDRSKTLSDELGKMGAKIGVLGDRMLINGGKPLAGAAVSSRGDHRIAMACSIAALGAHSVTLIQGAESVAKSYPGFYDDLRALGSRIDLAEQPIP